MQNTPSADLNAGPRRQVASSGRGPKSQGQNNLCVRAKIELYQFITVQYHKSAAGAGRSRFLRFMDYIITGRNATGAISLRRESAVAAIKKAVELMGDGHLEVQITDPDGRVYSHTEFSQLYEATRT